MAGDEEEDKCAITEGRIGKRNEKREITKGEII